MEDKGLHNLRPAPGATKTRKRVGRGPASGSGKTSGRGQKGQKSRSGSHNVRIGFEGGQMPLYMRIGKLRGSTKKMSMPMGPFRTRTSEVNVRALAGFAKGTDVTPQLMLDSGVVKTLKHPIKVLSMGDLDVALNVTAHRFSAGARAKIEAAGGTATVIEPPQRKRGGGRATEAGDATSGAIEAERPADDRAYESGTTAPSPADDAGESTGSTTGPVDAATPSPADDASTEA